MPKLACGNQHFLFVDSVDQVWGLGSNERGQLGIENGNNAILRPLQLPIRDIVSVACGEYFSICLDTSGSVWFFGSVTGMIEHKTRISRLALPQIALISCGPRDAFFYEANGTIWMLEPQYLVPSSRNTPVLLHSSPTITSMASMSDFELFLTDSGMLLDRSIKIQWKYRNLPRIAAVSLGYHHHLFLSTEGSLIYDGTIYNGREYCEEMQNLPPLSTGATVTAISSGNNCSMILDSDGRLWVCGYNRAWRTSENENQEAQSRALPSVATTMVPLDDTVVSIPQNHYNSLVVEGKSAFWIQDKQNPLRFTKIDFTERAPAPTVHNR